MTSHKLEGWQSFTFTVPLRTVSGLNAREHFRARARRVKKERDIIALVFPPMARGLLGEKSEWAGAIVRMIRFGPKKLDDDAPAGALKGVRDEIAELLGLTSDNDKRVKFIALQAKGDYAVGVSITRATEMDIAVWEATAKADEALARALFKPQKTLPGQWKPLWQPPSKRARGRREP